GVHGAGPTQRTACRRLAALRTRSSYRTCGMICPLRLWITSCYLTSCYLPPKSLLKDLNTRPGKSPALEGTFGGRWANGHCDPPCTWHATVGILSMGKSMS